MKKTKNKKSKAGLGYGMTVALVIGILFGYMAVQPQLEVDERGWHIIFEGSLAEAAEATPSAGASGFLSVYIHPHQASPDESYNENSSSNLETNCTDAGLGFANSNASDIDIAYSTSFDIVVRVRGNSTHCKRDSVWFGTDLKVEITSADLSIGADTAMTRVDLTDGNSSGYTYLYCNFYIDNSGSGYTISKGGSVEITSIKFSAYY